VGDAIRPYLAVNDRRALVRLKEIKSKVSPEYPYLTYIGKNYSVADLFSDIDALLAELPEDTQ
jgi:hypothetical protein